MKQDNKDFYPDYLFEIVVVIGLVITAATVLALLYPPSIGREIDFSAPYRPVPEWYFLWLYQLVRYFSGPWAFVGTVLLPVAAALTLVAMPFIDNGRRGRFAALVAGTILLGAFIILTLIPALSP